MAGIHQHHYKRKAMVEYGRMKKEFDFNDLLVFMNEYKTKEGKPHRNVPSTYAQLNNLLRAHPQFRNIGGNKWCFKETSENENE